MRPPVYCKQPTYYALPHRTTSGRQLRTSFDVYEIRAGGTGLCFTLSNRGDRLQNILKRGVPLAQALEVFYQMDGKE